MFVYFNNWELFLNYEKFVDFYGNFIFALFSEKIIFGESLKMKDTTRNFFLGDLFPIWKIIQCK